MNVKDFTVIRVKRKDITNFIEKWHYSHSINGCISDFCYGLFHTNTLIGALFYGRMAMANQYKKFSNDINNVIELRRLCCIDDTPKNTESYFIGKSLKLLKHDWRKGIVVSYADKEYNHTGIIYKATNFKMVGEIKGARVIIFNNKRYHDKSIRAKYKGKLKPFATKIKLALENKEAYYKNTKIKYTYVYNLNRGKHANNSGR